MNSVKAISRYSAFYRKLGFIAEGEAFIKAGIHHIRMVLDGERC